MPNKSSAHTKRIKKTRSANAFGAYDSIPYYLVDVNRANNEELVHSLGITAKAAEGIMTLRHEKPITDVKKLRSVRGISLQIYERIKRRILLPTDTSLHILDVTAINDYIFSNKPFTLRVNFFNNSQIHASILSVTVLWAGESFIVQKELTTDEFKRKQIIIEFDEEHTLPLGPAEFSVALYRLDGSQASFRKTFYVLPSNPLSLSLSPAGATLTGTWSARGAFQPSSDLFFTECTITIANGSANSVSMNQTVNWKFWDGGVGGTLVESGSFNWPSPITVSGYGVWEGRVWFGSPNGSSIYNRYHNKDDMTIEIQMAAGDNRQVTGMITCRVMLAYGVNIIKVGDFEYQEGIDLYDAVDITRQIYERRDIAFCGVLRWIINDVEAGGYRIINSEGEVYGLFSDWSVRNDYVDVFVCQDFVTGSFDGLSGGVPGPSSKGGNHDGVAVDKTSFVNGSGVKRLDIPYLGMLIGHEVGHYLGLPHISEARNLMLSSSGADDTDLNYDQYRLMLPHGFIVFT